MSEAARNQARDEIQAAEAEAVSQIVARAERQKAMIEEKATRRSARPSLLSVLALLLGVIAIGLWFMDPPWLRAEKAPPPSAEHLEKSGRIALFMLATRIEEYRTLKGHLPASLAEIGRASPEVEYKLLESDHYQLIYRSLAGVELAYDSTQNMSSFLGNALSELGILGNGR